ncbi:sensor domain-containing diguanylate cyclase [Blautia sp. MSJ-9]|uniref:sensor domain-containing diguanylate cyclase n=1 Tax=Blautia sp. MSJ-9 TaxID=2841511 RepID=UPI001C127D0C|nr:GGDEF domain-containing protein [Blautia sp. MSJ-9]MBU5680707.1 GGDEF domain-containing protein [Blautia sp. MSJ-9]
MKTTIKYELVINEAFRSALNYDTPDEQINEFICFLGRHIGSDRIYIFEDCDERHGTDNTYEWCAEGVIPEIDALQNVDMDIIDWWYETFSKGESVIVADVEAIKEEHPVSYDMLKAQNVENVVVCPLYYKDEIKGFFGVDNPPKGDFKGLITFMDMIGTLLISFLKLRNSFIKSNKLAKLSSYSSLAKIYESMHFINVQTKKYHIVKTTSQLTENWEKDAAKMEEYEIRDDFCGHVRHIIEKMCMESQLEEIYAFIDISTLEERISGKNSIIHEFIHKKIGWCRSRFIPVDYDENGKLLHVLFCIECIEEEKKRENRLLYLAQTDLMTGLYNRGSGEKIISDLLKQRTGGLLCLIDCDKFKTINDTYGHSVGDKVIIAIAEILQKSCRDNDVILRLGGDEFAIFMPGMLQKTSAEKFFDRLFGNIRQIDITEMRGKRIEVSLGACFYHESEEVSFDYLYRKADRAMYQGKKKRGYSATIYEE